MFYNVLKIMRDAAEKMSVIDKLCVIQFDETAVAE
jgi:hypothetical protein